MQFIDKLSTPGEHSLILEGQVGSVESILSVPPNAHDCYVAFLGHPHSLQGGTMNNKVVTTLARTFKELNIPSLRFNFRGVGQTQGVYDHGIGESEDMLVFVEQWLSEKPQAKFLFAGFSFGSYVTYRAAAQHPHDLLVSVAPPVHHYNYREFASVPYPWIILQGTTDDVVPLNLVDEFAKTSKPIIPMIKFEDTGHFFHGNLLLLRDKLLEAISELVPLT